MRINFGDMARGVKGAAIAAQSKALRAGYVAIPVL